MPSFESSNDETERLAELKSYKILDTVAEEGFDEIVRAASIVCQCPISLLSFVDADRQWFKSKVGIEIREVVRDFSFCSHTIAAKKMFLVGDASKDERFKNNPFVLHEPKIRFYGGVPLMSPTGHALGALCVIDSLPRQLTRDQTTLLNLLANLAAKQLESRKKELELKRTLTENGRQLQETAKLTTLAALAGGIAHEVNTPLAVIQGLVERLSRQVSAGKNDANAVFETNLKIINAVTRIAKIVRGVKNLSQTSSDSLELTSFETLIEDTLSFCTRRCRDESVEMRITPLEKPIRLYCKPIQISQVLLNLIHNGLDAIRDLPEKWIEVAIVDSESTVEISVTDSGPGIDKELRDKIFSSFFTTKGLGQGSGLGLSVSKEIIESHEGQLRYDESSAHTRFVLSLPKQLKR